MFSKIQCCFCIDLKIMRKIILLIMLFFPICLVSFNLEAGDFSNFTVVPAVNIVNSINQFRGEPFKFINNNFEDVDANAKYRLLSFLNQKIVVEQHQKSLPNLDYSDCLENIAREHIYKMVETNSIYHKDINSIENSCNLQFAGESIIAMAFQNYVDLESFQKIVFEYILKQAIFLNDAESAPVFFPYNKVGAALLTGSIDFEGISYNIYLLDIVYGVSTNIDSSSKLYFGKVESSSGIKQIKIYPLDNLNDSKETYTYADGSFWIYLDPGKYKFEVFSDSDKSDGSEEIEVGAERNIFIKIN